uniref:CAAX prenyl protease 1 homolog n=1 Tax=Styela clava TaxID=7725 RepID=UPI0019399E01|nr:CAAX prenyl protease 1 homolog [Styela clava]
MTTVLWFGGLPFVWDLSGAILDKVGLDENNEIVHSLVFALLGNIFSLIIDLPWKFYYTFVVEEKHGFNKMTVGFFFKDLIKKTLVYEAINLPIMSLIIYIVKSGGDYFFIYAWLMVFIISMILLHIYPEYIAPLFDKYTPLPEGDLKKKIEELADSLDYPLKKLYVVEGSKRSSHSNAYMYGFHKNKRIVLFDTLLEDYTPVTRTESMKDTSDTDETGKDSKTEDGHDKEKKKIGCNTEEVVAVLGHELGHWYYSHMVKNLVIIQLNIFLMFFVFGKLMNLRQLYVGFGFSDFQPILIRLYVVFSFIFSPFNEIMSFVMNVLSRRFEFQADEFAVNLGKREQLKTALLKLFKDNLAFPVADWLYSTRHFSHPPLLERLRGMDDVKQKSE